MPKKNNNSKRKAAFSQKGCADRLAHLISKTAPSQKVFLEKLDASDVTESALSKMLSGDQEISSGFLCDVAMAHSISLDWIVFGADNPISAIIHANNALRRPSYEVLEKLEKIADAVVPADFPFDAFGDDDDGEPACSARLKAFRLAQGLTGTELGQMLGVSLDSVLRAERAERLPRLNYLAALCSTFSISLDYLIFGYPCDINPLIGDILALFSYEHQLRVVRAWLDYLRN